MNYKIDIKALVTVSLLIAIEVVLNRFVSINTQILKIGFGFVPVAICGMLYGPVAAGIAGAVADILGSTLFPIGPFFPGFTLSAALYGVIFGLFLYKCKGNILQLTCAVTINCLAINLFLTTLWISITYGSNYLVLLPTRILPNAIMLTVQFVTLFFLQKQMRFLQKKFF